MTDASLLLLQELIGSVLKLHSNNLSSLPVQDTFVTAKGQTVSMKLSLSAIAPVEYVYDKRKFSVI